MRPLIPPAEAEEYFSKVALVNRKPPSHILSLDNNILLHVSRLCLLIRLTGKPKNHPALLGRTKLAKLDFFVRYPQYLQKAIDILGVRFEQNDVLGEIALPETIEAQMVRYRYGPWDQRYYVVLAYMTGKRLINVVVDNKIDKFVLLERGMEHADSLMDNSHYTDLVARIRLVGHVFGDKTGTWIKEFIYQQFPEVVRTPYNQYMPKVIGNE